MLDRLITTARDLWASTDKNEYLRGQVETITYAAWDEIPDSHRGDPDEAKDYIGRLILDGVASWH